MHGKDSGRSAIFFLLIRQAWRKVMTMRAIAVAAALVLGGNLAAFAQDGPPSKDKEMQAPSQSREDPRSMEGSQSNASEPKDDKGSQRQSKADDKASRDKGAEKSADKPASKDRQAREEG